MSLFSSVVLGIIQGLTEFLPVSSSGHLVLFSHLLGIQSSSVVFEVLVHVGTLAAVLAVFRREFAQMLLGFVKILRHPSRLSGLYKSDDDCRLFVWLVVGTLPTIAAALLFKDQVEQAFQSTRLVGGSLILTGIILYAADRFAGGKSGKHQTLLDSLCVGIGQAVAVIPGISRSGATIAAGLARGLSREQAARFSFLLSIPSILGALVYSLPDLVDGSAPASIGIMLAGVLAAGVTGYLAIHLLLAVVRRGRLVWFSYYTWLVGILVLLFA